MTKCAGEGWEKTLFLLVIFPDFYSSLSGATVFFEQDVHLSVYLRRSRNRK